MYLKNYLEKLNMTNLFRRIKKLYSYIQGVIKSYGTNFRTHSSHLEDKIMLYELGAGNALFPC